MSERTSYERPDLAPELQQFINAVSSERKTAAVDGYDSSRKKIYAMVPGTADLETFDSDELGPLIGRLEQVGTDALVRIEGENLWATFFQVDPAGGNPSTTARAYVHATDWKAGLELLGVIGRQSRIRSRRLAS